MAPVGGSDDRSTVTTDEMMAVTSVMAPRASMIGGRRASCYSSDKEKRRHTCQNSHSHRNLILPGSIVHADCGSASDSIGGNGSP